MQTTESTPQAVDHVAENGRSYQLNGMAPGTRVVARRDIFPRNPERVPEGTRGTTIGTTTNAGFRGIEASVRWDNGETTYSVTCGALYANR